MTDRDALLAAILADPADDTRRLAFADLLDETGEPERAEFIRVQIELAKWPHVPRERPYLRKEMTEPMKRHVEDALEAGIGRMRRREGELFSEDGNRVRWKWGLGGGFRHRLSNCPSLDATDTHAIFHRGFVAKVGLPLAAFMRHARELARHPLEVVRLTDRRPVRIEGELEILRENRWTFMIGAALSGTSPIHLPQEIWYCFEKSWFATEEDANSALSRACLAYLRSL